ncbi:MULTISPECIES: hypothetical protein [Halorubrum]|uniref:Sulfatase n=1 Tax=Halorubrum hochstenium ATCC 700873 TaxID=1227481 RepID=M0EXW1_9EURY|nr:MULTISPECIES: hypothetical protein [Halorubrum]ELZ52530.1 hypothetical protein C467_13969 [Halorubrum hochstenium ATCC 700873]
MRTTNSIVQNFKEFGIRGVGQYLYEKYYGPIARRNAQNIYEKKWDVLILLDCTRRDMLRSVLSEYEYLSRVGEHMTPGTSSAAWMRQTFKPEYAEEMNSTLHITGNPNTEQWVDEDDFLHLNEVWRDGWSNEHATVLPSEITDRAIALHRELDPERTILHYMQPHPPFIPDDVGIDKSVEDLASEGYSQKELWELHLSNLRYVLDNLKTLLSNLEAERVIISSDHGQALGERGKWGHPGASRLDCLRRVPWSVTTGKDTEEYSPEYRVDINEESGQVSRSTEQKLKNLGYRT